jgi:type IV pilus assembly protein PilA
MKTLRNNEGFSLVELMVVVAIIGVLAAISVGQVTKQIAKARQSEVKTNLSSLYTAEKAVYAEFANYTGAWNQLAFGVEGNVRYDVGFSGSAPVLTAAMGWTGPAGTGISNASGYCNAAVSNGACTVIKTNGSAPNAPATAVAANGATFRAQGHAFVFQNGLDDVWQIDNNKKVSNTASGIP